MHSSTVDAEVNGEDGQMLVQGFRPLIGTSEGYVLIALGASDVPFQFEATLSPEDAHIISEEIRKHAEFAQSVREWENE